MNSISTSSAMSSRQEYGTIVGQFDHDVSQFGQPHARFDLSTTDGQQFEADINVQSDQTADGSPGSSDVEYSIQDKVVSQLPPEGEHLGGSFSYADSGLTEADFKPVAPAQFQQQLLSLAQQSERISLSGMIYSDPGKTGIHDIHQTTGNDNPAEDHPGEDGVARFYLNENGQIHEESVFVKFQSQNLPQGS